MDLGRAIVTSVVLGAAAYVLPRLAYLALEKDKLQANNEAMAMVFKDQSAMPKPEPFIKHASTDRGMYL